MALSNTFTFNLDRDALIKKAMLMLGVIGTSQDPTTDETTSATNSLNLMLKAWQADGMQLWQVRTESVTPLAATNKYEMGPGGDINTTVKPVEVMEAYRRVTDTQIDVPLIRLSREDFWTLSDKDSTGSPVNFYFEIQEGVLNNFWIWPIADTNFIANSTIEILYQQPFDDMTAATDDLAFPQEWELAVVYGLAVILAPEYGAPLSDQQLLIVQADKEKQRVMDWDTEHTSVFFQPHPVFTING